MVVLRADGCASEHYPCPQPIAQRRASDPSGQSISTPTPSQRVQVAPYIPPGQIVMAIPTGSYTRPTRTTGSIEETAMEGVELACVILLFCSLQVLQNHIFQLNRNCVRHSLSSSGI
jgi:hypothetical protein